MDNLSGLPSFLRAKVEGKALPPAPATKKRGRSDGVRAGLGSKSPVGTEVTSRLRTTQPTPVSKVNADIVQSGPAKSSDLGRVDDSTSSLEEGEIDERLAKKRHIQERKPLPLDAAALSTIRPVRKRKNQTKPNISENLERKRLEEKREVERRERKAQRRGGYPAPRDLQSEGDANEIKPNRSSIRYQTTVVPESAPAGVSGAAENLKLNCRGMQEGHRPTTSDAGLSKTNPAIAKFQKHPESGETKVTADAVEGREDQTDGVPAGKSAEQGWNVGLSTIGQADAKLQKGTSSTVTHVKQVSKIENRDQMERYQPSNIVAGTLRETGHKTDYAGKGRRDDLRGSDDGLVGKIMAEAITPGRSDGMKRRKSSSISKSDEVHKDGPDVPRPTESSEGRKGDDKVGGQTKRRSYQRRGKQPQAPGSDIGHQHVEHEPAGVQLEQSEQLNRTISNFSDIDFSLTSNLGVSEQPERSVNAANASDPPVVRIFFGDREDNCIEMRHNNLIEYSSILRCAVEEHDGSVRSGHTILAS